MQVNTLEFELFVILYLLITSAIILVLIFYLTQIFIRYDLAVSIQMTFIIIGLSFRSISFYIFYLNKIYFLFSDYNLNLIHHIFLMIFFLSLVIFSNSLNKIFAKKQIGYLTYVPLSIFLILGILAFSDLLLPDFHFFKIIIDEFGYYSTFNDQSISILRIIGNLMLISLLITLFNNPKKPSLLFSWEHTKYVFLILVLILLTFDLANLSDFLIHYFENVNLIVNLIYITTSLSISILTLFLVHNTLKKPSFTLFFGKDINLAIKEGIIGYILAAFTEIGPDAVAVSSQFKNYSKISETTINGLSINAIATVGSFRENPDENFKETVSLFPVPNNPTLSAIAITFNTIDEKISKREPRMKSGIPTALIIIFPSDTLLVLHKFLDILPILQKEVKNNNQLNRFKNNEILETLTYNIIKEMIY